MDYVRIAAAAITLLLLSGCINSNPDYPAKSWPIRITQNSCPSIAGRYANRGEMEPKNYGSYVPELAPFFAETMTVPEYRDKYSKADNVALTFDNGVLTAQIMAGETILTADVFSEKDGSLICKPEGVIIRDSSGWAKGNGNVLAGMQYISYTLMATEDHSLIIKSKSGGTGLAFMLFPVSSSETNWFHFLRWQPQATAPAHP